MISEEALRKRLFDVHENQRNHMWRVIEGLSEESITRTISDEERIPSVLSILIHIANAETYWMHKAGNDLAPPLRTEAIRPTLDQLRMITEGFRKTLFTCPLTQLRVQSPVDKRPPSIAWVVLRTGMHGIYHTGQIAKVRHMVGVTPLSVDDELWEKAVDSFSVLLGEALGN